MTETTLEGAHEVFVHRKSWKLQSINQILTITFISWYKSQVIAIQLSMCKKTTKTTKKKTCKCINFTDMLFIPGLLGYDKYKSRRPLLTVVELRTASQFSWFSFVNLQSNAESSWCKTKTYAFSWTLEVLQSSNWKITCLNIMRTSLSNCH